MFYHEAKETCKTVINNISRRNEKSKNDMDKVSARQALSSNGQWRSDDLERSFEKSDEPETGYRLNRQILPRTGKH